MQVSRRFIDGLTLIELLVTLFVLALLQNLSTPGMLYLVQQKASEVTINCLHRNQRHRWWHTPTHPVCA